MAFRLRRLAALCLLGLTMLAAAPAAAADCYGPSWQTISDPSLGLRVDVTADTYRNYHYFYEFPAVSVSERARGGGEIAGRCSDFSFTMADLGDQQVGNTEGLFNLLQNNAVDGLRDGRIVSSRSLTFQGSPAREFTYSFTIDFFYTAATHRVLVVARGNRLYYFDWSWGDDEGAPADSNRIFNSIRFIDGATDPNLATLAMLDITLHSYWLYYPDSTGDDYMSPALHRIADPKREREAAIVKGYGYFDSPRFVRMENGWKVFRIEHQNATVDWYVQDNGRQITGLTWKKL